MKNLNYSYKAQLEERMEANYSQIFSEWSELNGSEIVEKAGEIYATRLILDHMICTLSEDDAEWLLRFENPLVLLRDKWLEVNATDNSQNKAMAKAIGAAMKDDIADCTYDLVSAASPAFMQQGVATC